MLEENVREWTREWLEQGRAQSGCSRTGSGASGAAGSSSSTPPRSSTLFRRGGGNSTILCVNALISSSSRP